MVEDSNGGLTSLTEASSVTSVSVCVALIVGSTTTTVGLALVAREAVWIGGRQCPLLVFFGIALKGGCTAEA